MDNTIRMIGIDLDGTLLTRQKVLTSVSRAALEQAIHMGVEVVPVTGRPLAGVPREVLEIPGIRYVITSNGANTYDLSAQIEDRGRSILSGTMNGKTPGTVLHKAHLSHEVVRRVLDAAPGDKVIREIFIRGVGYHDPHTHAMLQERFSIAPPILDYIMRSRKVVSDFEELLSNPSSHVENISLKPNGPGMDREHARQSSKSAGPVICLTCGPDDQRHPLRGTTIWTIQYA